MQDSSSAMCLSARLIFRRAPSQIGISFLRLRYDNTMTIEHKLIVSLEARSADRRVYGLRPFSTARDDPLHGRDCFFEKRI